MAVIGRDVGFINQAFTNGDGRFRVAVPVGSQVFLAASAGNEIAPWTGSIDVGNQIIALPMAADADCQDVGDVALGE